MLADDESWETVGTYHDPAINLPNYHLFEDEIMQVATDGSQRIRRLCHTRSAIDNQTATTGYWATPKPTISRDGRYIAFTSNWEKSGRYDLFILKVEPAESLSPKATPATTLPTQRPRRVNPR
jgi:Tol biopolymer transport system component